MAKKFFFFRSVGSIAPKIMGVMTIGVVVGLYFNLDTALLSRLPSTLFLSNVLEKKLVALKPSNSQAQAATPTITGNTPVLSSLPVLGKMPAFSGISDWLNSLPLTRHALRGKVVLVDFWTYSCINCIRTLPYVERWYEKYKDQGLVVIGVHTPEFSFEKKVSNVEGALKQFGITYPVAIDSNYGTWNAYRNQFWPAHYLIDARGRIREVHFGEGKYRKTEADIQSLLKEAGVLKKNVEIGSSFGSIDFSQIQSPETYLGYARAENFASSEPVDPDNVRAYSFPSTLNMNAWAIRGKWKIKGEKILLNGRKGAIEFRFHAPKLNIVMKGTEKGVSAQVFLDGKPLSASLDGSDLSRSGMVNVKEAKLYNLVTLPASDTRSHLFEIRFADPGVSVYTFTFG
jgi:thiol-disulfide isomerase/thioredoxin